MIFLLYKIDCAVRPIALYVSRAESEFSAFRYFIGKLENRYRCSSTHVHVYSLLFSEKVNEAFCSIKNSVKQCIWMALCSVNSSV